LNIKENRVLQSLGNSVLLDSIKKIRS